MIVDYIIVIAVVVSMLMSSLTAYFFWLSNNGELRKILIGKFVTQAIFWFVLLLMLPVEAPLWKRMVVCVALLALNVWKFRLQKYLVETIRKK